MDTHIGNFQAFHSIDVESGINDTAIFSWLHRTSPQLQDVEKMRRHRMDRTYRVPSSLNWLHTCLARVFYLEAKGCIPEFLLYASIAFSSSSEYWISGVLIGTGPLTSSLQNAGLDSANLGCPGRYSPRYTLMRRANSLDFL